MILILVLFAWRGHVQWLLKVCTIIPFQFDFLQYMNQRDSLKWLWQQSVMPLCYIEMIISDKNC